MSKQYVVLDTNVLMDCIILDDNREYNYYLELVDALKIFGIDSDLLLEANKKDRHNIRMALKQRLQKAQCVSSNVEKALTQLNAIPVITDTIVKETKNNLSFEGGKFQVDKKKIAMNDTKYIRKVISRFLYNRYESIIDHYIGFYKVLPLPPVSQSILEPQDRTDGDHNIWDTMHYHGIKYIITNNKKDFQEINSYYGTKTKNFVKIITPSFSTPVFGISESHASNLILMLESLFY